MTATTSDIGMIFTGESVREILEGRKTMTRRIVKPQPPSHHWETFASNTLAEYELAVTTDGRVASWTPRHRVRGGPWQSDDPHRVSCRYQVGDRILVRETFDIVSDPGVT